MSETVVDPHEREAHWLLGTDISCSMPNLEQSYEIDLCRSFNISSAFSGTVEPSNSIGHKYIGVNALGIWPLIAKGSSLAAGFFWKFRSVAPFRTTS